MNSLGDGLILVDKPEEMTSHAVVKALRRCLAVQQIGHAGTLDPLASGLLPCLVGRATRLERFLHLWPKVYVGVIALGEETETGDRESVKTGQHCPTPDPRLLRIAETRFSGVQQQVPPAYSAKKIGGVRAHRVARQGFDPVLLPVTVTIERLSLRPMPDGYLKFAARVSSGTYLRSLARDLGRFFGTGGYLARLRRTAIGPLRLREAARFDSLDRLGAGAPSWRPISQIPLPLERVALTGQEVTWFLHGRAVPEEPEQSGWVSVHHAADGRLLGIAERVDSALKPRAVLVNPNPTGPGREDFGGAGGVD